MSRMVYACSNKKKKPLKEKYRGGKAKWKTHQQQQQQTLFTEPTWLALLECSFEIEIFLVLSFSFLRLHTLSQYTKCIFPFIHIYVCASIGNTSCRYCHLTRVCGSELAILFPHSPFHVCLVGVLRKCFFVYCDCFNVTLWNNRWWKETTRTKWMNFV